MKQDDNKEMDIESLHSAMEDIKVWVGDKSHTERTHIITSPQTARFIRDEISGDKQEETQMFNFHDLGEFSFDMELEEEQRYNIARTLGLPVEIIESNHVDPTVTYVIPEARVKVGNMLRDVAIKIETKMNDMIINTFRYGATPPFGGMYGAYIPPRKPERMAGESLHNWANYLWESGHIEDPYYRRQYSAAVWRALGLIVSWPARRVWRILKGNG